MRAALMCVVSLLIAVNGSAQVELTQAFETTDDFTISLPAGWHEIPKDVLETLTSNLAQLAPQAPIQVYDYGFQLDAPPEWFQHPYILVQVRNTGRTRPSELESMSKIEREMQRGLKETQDSWDSILSEFELGQTLYDPVEQILWVKFSMEVAEVGRVHGLTAAILTEHGAIQVHSYAPAGEFADYTPLFEAISRNVSVSESIQYRPHFTDSIPGFGLMRSALTWGLMGAFIAFLASIPRWLISVSKRKASEEAE